MKTLPVKPVLFAAVAALALSACATATPYQPVGYVPSTRSQNIGPGFIA